MQLRKFKQVVRGINDRTIVDPLTKNAFKPIAITHERFAALGILGKQLARHQQLDIDGRTQCDIGDHLIKLGLKMSGVKLEKFKSNINSRL